MGTEVLTDKERQVLEHLNRFFDVPNAIRDNDKELCTPRTSNPARDQRPYSRRS
jgi:hypothetical protein